VRIYAGSLGFGFDFVDFCVTSFILGFFKLYFELNKGNASFVAEKMEWEKYVLNLTLMQLL
jgi:hypothetical protein